MDITLGLTVVTASTTAGAMASVIDAVEALYLDIDRDTAAFSALAGVACTDGCGRCCRGVSIDASVLELLPMARALFRSGLIDAWAADIDAAPAPGPCVVFARDAAVEGNGRCRLYGWRPLVCRLFGFAGRRNKAGRPEYRPCREMADRDAAGAKAALPDDAIPVFADHYRRAWAIDETLGRTIMPVNRALRQAVQRYGLVLQLQAEGTADPIQNDPQSGPRGRRPPRLAA